MPIYEYKAKNGSRCKLCKNKFEVRQSINDEPLTRCPECGAEIRRLFSRPFVVRKESAPEDEAFDEFREGEDSELGLDEGFDEEEEVWE